MGQHYLTGGGANHSVRTRQVGQDAADALAASFCLGEPAALEALVAASFGDVEVREHAGCATFESIEAWVDADVRRWTLADVVDDEQHRRLVAAAQVELAPFTDGAGRVDFAIPALIATGRRR